MSAKAALYTSMHALKMSKAELARHLNCDEREVGRLLNPRHQSQLHKIESALSILGKKLVVGYITNPQKPNYQSAPHV
jgi:antitoxin HicB